MKSALRLTAAAALAATALAACSKPAPPPAAKPVINFSILSAEDQQSMAKVWQPLIDDMSKQTGLTIKAYYAGNVFGTGTHVAFLAAALYERLYFNIFINIKDTNTFRAMKFMACSRDKIYRRVTQIKRIVTYGLHGIGVEDGIVFPAQVTHSMNIDQVTDFVVGMH